MDKFHIILAIFLIASLSFNIATLCKSVTKRIDEESEEEKAEKLALAKEAEELQRGFKD